MSEAQRVIIDFMPGMEDSDGYMEIKYLTRELWKEGAYITQAEKMLAVFQHAQTHNNGFVPTSTLSAMFKQYNARILELRNGKVNNVLYAIQAKKKDGEYGFEYRGVRNKYD
jgi:hypothetical protein